MSSTITEPYFILVELQSDKCGMKNARSLITIKVEFPRIL